MRVIYATQFYFISFEIKFTFDKFDHLIYVHKADNS